jgi:DNA-binding HxlR family transcriptional regulator
MPSGPRLSQSYPGIANRAPMRGPVSSAVLMMVALDLLGRRWTMRVIRELQQQPAGFGEPRRRCDDMSSSVLSDRLHGLRETGIVEVGQDGTYGLTPLGARLDDALAPLLGWATDWSPQLEQSQ